MTIPLPDIDLDSKLLLAQKGCGYEDAKIIRDVGNDMNKDRRSFVVVDKVNIFEPTSPDTLQRLRFELLITVYWSRFLKRWMVTDEKQSVIHECTTQAEIDSATIECALAVLRGGE